MWDTDTAGAERYESLAPLYYRGAAIVCIVFDVMDARTLEKAKKIVSDIQNIQNEYSHEKKKTIVLLANKYENNEINLDKYLDYANKNNILFFPCSAKLGYNVEESMSITVSTHLENNREHNTTQNISQQNQKLQNVDLNNNRKLVNDLKRSQCC